VPSHRYTGPYDEEGLFHGTGKLEALNGDVYEGNFVHGYFSGQGKYLFKKNDDSMRSASITVAIRRAKLIGGFVCCVC
jgi:hypothetical protein